MRFFTEKEAEEFGERIRQEIGEGWETKLDRHEGTNGTPWWQLRWLRRPLLLVLSASAAEPRFLCFGVALEGPEDELHPYSLDTMPVPWAYAAIHKGSRAVEANIRRRQKELAELAKALSDLNFDATNRLLESNGKEPMDRNRREE